jgi:hypothetical protein
MDTTMRVKINKNQYRGWSVKTYVQYPDWPNEVMTSTGYGTLKSTLWHTVLNCIDLGAVLTTIHVKGRLMPKSEIWERVHKALTGGTLSYNLPAIKEYLEVTQ